MYQSTVLRLWCSDSHSDIGDFFFSVIFCCSAVQIIYMNVSEFCIEDLHVPSGNIWLPDDKHFLILFSVRDVICSLHKYQTNDIK